MEFGIKDQVLSIMLQASSTFNISKSSLEIFEIILVGSGRVGVVVRLYHVVS